MYQSLIFVCSSGLILGAKLITKVLVAPEYYSSWRYMPTLVIAMAVSTLVSFIGTIYTVEKRSQSALWTTLVGTVINIIGNFLLISAFGVQGAALSTAFSYAVVLVIRSVHTRRFIPIQWDLPRFSIGFGLIIVQSVVMILEMPGWLYIEGALLLAILALNAKTLLSAISHFIGSKRGKDVA